jgi:hypothetical protein
MTKQYTHNKATKSSTLKKVLILVALFIVPITFDLILSSGKHQFGHLPVLTENVAELQAKTSDGKQVFLNDNITILGFLGKDALNRKDNIFNLNEKIYKRFYKYDGLQFIMVLPKGLEDAAEELKKQLASYTDTKKWKFVFMDDEAMVEFFASLETPYTLDKNLGIDLVFILGRKKNLRGRKKDQRFGYNASVVADLNNYMIDDVKIILAEYRLALKVNNAQRPDDMLEQYRDKKQ